MDAKTNLKARLPSRHVTEGPDRAPAAATAFVLPGEPCRLAAARMRDPCAKTFDLTFDLAFDLAFELTFELSGVAAVFKRTSSVPDLKPAGRDVAKDLVEGRFKKPKHSGPAPCFDAEEACLRAVTTRKYREGDVWVMGDAGPNCGPATTTLAKDLFGHGEVAIRRACAHAGGAAEVRSYADI
jgi:hypothetical protein